MTQRRALILSGGAMFGAWQVGAWAALENRFRPDVVVGCSIGALNGWAIAGGASAAELAEWWRKAAAEGKLHWRFPRRPLDGFLDCRQIEGWIRELHGAYTPRLDYRAALTDLYRLKPRLAAASEITWEHLLASCALLGILPQKRLGNVVYSDGGMLSALPMWAAAEVQATYSLGLNVMPRMPWPVRALLRPVRAMRGLGGPPAEALILEPSRPLGSWTRSIAFDRDQIERWMRQGRQDVEHFHTKTF